MIFVNQNKKIWLTYAYFIALLLIMTSWTNTESAPSMVLRVMFLVALFLVPVFSKQMNLLPAVLTCFFTVSSYGFSYSYMPSSYKIYCIPLLLCLLLSPGTRNHSFKIPVILVVLCIYTMIVDGLMSFQIQKVSFCYFILIAFILIADTDSVIDIKTFAAYLAMATVVLDLFFILLGSQFTMAYGSSTGLERMGWMDPNYFSTTIGFSVMVSLSVLVVLKTNVLEKTLLVANVAGSFFVMVLVASRGGILSLAVSGLVLLLFSKIKIRYKILFLLLAVAFVVLLFEKDYFELLIYRIYNDFNAGSGRGRIWDMKLQGFLDSSPLVWLFGMGYHNGDILGGSHNYYRCFHNDYLAYLVCYGLIGLVLFLSFLFYPIKYANKCHKAFPIIITLIIYLAIVSMTLNPLSEGYLVYFCFYYFILLLMRHSNINFENE